MCIEIFENWTQRFFVPELYFWIKSSKKISQVVDRDLSYLWCYKIAMLMVAKRTHSYQLCSSPGPLNIKHKVMLNTALLQVLINCTSLPHKIFANSARLRRYIQMTKIEGQLSVPSLAVCQFNPNMLQILHAAFVNFLQDCSRTTFSHLRNLVNFKIWTLETWVCTHM